MPVTLRFQCILHNGHETAMRQIKKHRSICRKNCHGLRASALQDQGFFLENRRHFWLPGWHAASQRSIGRKRKCRNHQRHHAAEQGGGNHFLVGVSHGWRCDCGVHLRSFYSAATAAMAASGRRLMTGCVRRVSAASARIPATRAASGMQRRAGSVRAIRHGRTWGQQTR